MITAIDIAASGDAFALFYLAFATAVSTILVGHTNSPPFGYNSVLDP
jgi:hypothetical protein